MTQLTGRADFSSALRPPGGMMVWVLIFMELLAFALAFVAFFIVRAGSLEVFESSQAQLSQPLGLANTLVLVSSGYFVVLANGCHDLGDPRGTVRYLIVAMSLGGVFVVVKAIEYRDKIAQGLTTGVNQFFDFYWLLTAFHLAHVVLGLLLLAYMTRRVATSRAGRWPCTSYSAPDF